MSAKEQEYPGMNGWVSLRLSTLGETEQSQQSTTGENTRPFDTFYLTLKVSPLISYFCILHIIIEINIMDRMVVCDGSQMNSVPWVVDVDILSVK
jgi:hypothetical protein